jgi:tRNA threonylcarbamoyl adenosine modification protein (Sua5/YciO/YrdC/YwlC family)
VSRTFHVDPARLDQAVQAMAAAAKAVEDGLLVVLPTETVYGIACRPDHPDATERLFRAKQRALGLNLPVLAGSAEDAWKVGQANEAARTLARAFWPGPLTLVLPRTERSRPWHLGEVADTVAVRVPDHPLCAALLARTGPLAASSANLSGLPTPADEEGLIAAFGEAIAVHVFLAPGVSPPSGLASTVVDLTGASPRVTREGPVTSGDVVHALARQAR